MALEQDASSRSENLHVGRRKRASTLRIASCVKNGTTRKIVSSNQCQPLAAVSPTTTFVKFEILFTAFLEKKTQLWKLM